MTADSTIRENYHSHADLPSSGRLRYVHICFSSSSIDDRDLGTRTVDTVVAAAADAGNKRVVSCSVIYHAVGLRFSQTAFAGLTFLDITAISAS